jgi:large subunit ribosomal protein L4
MKVMSIEKTGATSSVTVPAALFGAPVNKTLLAQAIRVYLSNARQGTSKVKTRSEVNLTKKKVYKQKGTGNARHGSKNAPIFVGGGIAHGPTGIENWNKNLSKKMKNSALISALSAQASNSVICNTLSAVNGKTKEVIKLLSPVLSKGGKVLVVLGERNEITERAFANVAQVAVTTAAYLTAYDVSAYNQVVFDMSAIAALETRLLPKKAVTKAVAEKATLPSDTPKKAVVKKTVRKSTKKSE